MSANPAREHERTELERARLELEQQKAELAATRAEARARSHETITDMTGANSKANQQDRAKVGALTVGAPLVGAPLVGALTVGVPMVGATGFEPATSCSQIVFLVYRGATK